MKISIIYYSETGNTEMVARFIAEGVKSVNNSKVSLFNIKNVDEKFLDESKAIIIGAPTYSGNACWQMQKWLQEVDACKLSGKIGSAFTTANFIHGGSEVSIATINNALLVKGALIYSGGVALGLPFTHTGVVAIKNHYDEAKELSFIFGQRISNKCFELFNQ